MKQSIPMSKIPTGEELGKVIQKAVKAKMDSGRAKTLAEIGRGIGVTSAAISYWSRTGKVKEDRMESLIRYFKDVTKPADWGLEAWPDWAEKPTAVRKWFDKSTSNAVWSELLANNGPISEEFFSAYFGKRPDPREEWIELFDNAEPEAQAKALRIVRILLK